MIFLSTCGLVQTHNADNGGAQNSVKKMLVDVTNIQYTVYGHSKILKVAARDTWLSKQWLSNDVTVGWKDALRLGESSQGQLQLGWAVLVMIKYLANAQIRDDDQQKPIYLQNKVKSTSY